MMNMVLSAAIEAQAGEALEISSRAMQLRDRFLGYGVEATASTPAELSAIIAAEIPSWRKVIEERNVKTE